MKSVENQLNWIIIESESLLNMNLMLNLVDIIITLIIKLRLNLNFNVWLTYEEIKIRTEYVNTIISLNLSFFKDFSQSIEDILLTSKTNFKLSGLNLSTKTLKFIYFSIIVKSFVFVKTYNVDFIDNLFNLKKLSTRPEIYTVIESKVDSKNIIARELIISNVRNLTIGLNSLTKNFDFWKKVTRMIIGLSTIEKIEKIINTSKDRKTSNFKTQIYLKFRCDLKLTNVTKLSTHFSFSKFCYYVFNSSKHAYHVMMGGSFLSTYYLIKKAKYQKIFNKLEINSLLKISNTAFRVDVQDWWSVEKLVLSHLNDQPFLKELREDSEFKTIEDVFLKMEDSILYWAQVNFTHYQLASQELKPTEIKNIYYIYKLIKINVLFIDKFNKKDLSRSALSWPNQIDLDYSNLASSYNNCLMVIVYNGLIVIKREMFLLKMKNEFNVNITNKQVLVLIYDILKMYLSDNLEEKYKKFIYDNINWLKINSITTSENLSLFLLFLEKLKIFILNLLSDRSLFTEYNLTLIDKALTNFRISFKHKKKSEELRREFQRWQFIYVAKYSSQIKKLFYFNHFKDFRGRIYSNSLLHPMYNKLLRIYLTFPNLNNEFNLPLSEADYKHIRKSEYYSVFIKELGSFQNYKLCDYYNNIFDTDMDKYLAGLVFLELGKMNKNKLISKHSNRLSLKIFIEEGENIIINIIKKRKTTNFVNLNDNYLAILNELETDLTLFSILNEFRDEEIFDLVDVLKIAYYVKILLTFYKTRRWINFTVERDATGSTYQLWPIVNPLLDLKMLFILNLEGNLWCDIYTYIINSYLSDNKKILDTFTIKTANVLNRKHLKRTIMTVNYNVSRWRSYNYFKASAIDFEKLNSDEFDELFLLHNSFFNYVDTTMFTKLYTHDKYTWSLNFMQKEGGVLSRGGENKNLTYLALKGRQKESVIKYGDVKWKFSTNELSDDTDLKSTLRSLPANTIQSLDAELMSFIILNNRNIAPIHDSIITSALDLGSNMDSINLYFYIELKKTSNVEKKYSLFIFL